MRSMQILGTGAALSIDRTELICSAEKPAVRRRERPI
jgi:hypothetical protein